VDDEETGSCTGMGSTLSRKVNISSDILGLFWAQRM
jgi:hypothetical protein